MMHDLCNKEINCAIKLLAELKTLIESNGFNELGMRVGQISYMLGELACYNRLMCESYDTIEEVNMWDSIMACVRSSNYGHDRRIRPKVEVVVCDKTSDDPRRMTFNLDNNRNSLFRNSMSVSNCFRIMQLAPMLIMDNAFKYCDPGGTISVIVERDELMTTFTFKNLGPRLSNEELSNVWSENVRGENALKTNLEGQGLGLFMLRMILDMHSHLAASYQLQMDDNVVIVNGLPYATFSLKINLLNEPCVNLGQANLSQLTPRLDKYVKHQYIRLMPRLCKLAGNMFQELFARCPESFRDTCLYEICDAAYDLKDCLFSLLKRLQDIDDDFFDFSERSADTQTRLDRYLRREMEYLIDTFDAAFRFVSEGVTGEPYRGSDCISPYIDIFVSDFVKWLVFDSGVVEVGFVVGRNSIEFVCDGEFDISKATIGTWRKNLINSNLEIQITASAITIL